jgi:hypothetical protein
MSINICERVNVVHQSYLSFTLEFEYYAPAIFHALNGWISVDNTTT